MSLRQPVVRNLILAACLFLALHVWLLQGTVFGPQLVAHSDLYEYFLPAFAAPAAIWSEFEFSGFPTFIDPQNATWYPARVLFSGLLGWWGGYVAFAYVLAACAACAYVYRITGCFWGGLVAGLAYSLSEGLTEKIPHIASVHGLAWLPLLLLAVEHLRARPTRGWWCVGAATTGCLILAGHPQIAVYCLYWSGAYAVLAGLMGRLGWRYWLAVGSMLGVGAMLAGVQLIPLAEATSMLTRDAVSFSQFTSFYATAAEFFAGVYPMIVHEGREAPLYVGLGTLILSLIALSGVRSDWRITFWATTVVVALLLAAGPATPVARIAYEVPLYDKFRVVGRHLVLLSLAMASLAGYGIAAIRGRRASLRTVLLATGVLAALMGGGMYAIRQGTLPVAEASLAAWRPWTLYSTLPVQVALALLTATGILLLLRHPRSTMIAAGFVALLTLDLLGSQYTYVGPGGYELPGMLEPGAMRPSVHTTRFLGRLEPRRQRLLAIAGGYRDDLVPGVFARLWRVPSAGGLNPLLLRNYAELVGIENNGALDPRRLRFSDRSLDLLAVRYLIVREDDLQGAGTVEQSGLSWDAESFELPIGREDCGHLLPGTARLTLTTGRPITTLAFVGHLRCSEDLPQGEAFAQVTLYGDGDEMRRLPLRAGIEMSDLAHETDAVRDRIAHEMAPVFDQSDSDEGPLHEYLAILRLDSPMQVGRVQIDTGALYGWLQIDRMTVVDDRGAAIPQPLLPLLLSEPSRWAEDSRLRTSRHSDRERDVETASETGYLILRNRRALPRAWIVGRLIAMDRDSVHQAISQSQMPDGSLFDPRREALIDEPLDPTPKVYLGGGRMATIAALEGTFEEVRVVSDHGGFLVLSDVWYPGWRAAVDGVPTPVYRVNLALRAVEIPPGEHTVRFRFRPRSLYLGGLVSCLAILTLLLIVATPFWRSTVLYRGSTADGPSRLQ